MALNLVFTNLCSQTWERQFEVTDFKNRFSTLNASISLFLKQNVPDSLSAEERFVASVLNLNCSTLHWWSCQISCSVESTRQKYWPVLDSIISKSSKETHYSACVLKNNKVVRGCHRMSFVVQCINSLVINIFKR